MKNERKCLGDRMKVTALVSGDPKVRVLNMKNERNGVYCLLVLLGYAIFVAFLVFVVALSISKPVRANTITSIRESGEEVYAIGSREVYHRQLVIEYLEARVAEKERKALERDDADYRFKVQYLSATQAEKDWLIRVGQCESGWNPNAVSSTPVTYWLNGLYHEEYATGIFQFLPSTWERNCVGDIMNGDDQIQCALSMYRKGQSGQWSCK